MAARIAVIHDNRWYRDRLANALREQGHVVTVFDDPATVEGISPVADEINVSVLEVAGHVPGVRLVVTSTPKTTRMAGWSAFLASPVTAIDVASAVRRLLPSTESVTE
jgi:hypothetical protein